MELLDLLDQLARQTGQLASRSKRQAPGQASQTERAGDRFGTGPLHRFDLRVADQRVVYGRVVAVVASCHWYRVQLDGLLGTLPCCALSQTSLASSGCRSLNLYAPGTRVQVVLSPNLRFGSILGAAPQVVRDPRLWPPDAVSQASRCGMQVDSVHYYPLQMEQGGNVYHYGSGRPLDQLPGDTGVLSHTGLGYFADERMAFLGREGLGLQVFEEWEQARLAAMDLQLVSSGHVEEYADDQGETHYYRGVSLTPREQLGELLPGATLTRRHSAQESQLDSPHLAAAEPAHDDQQPFHRLQHYGGYKGDVAGRFVVAPPLPRDGSGVLRYSQQDPYPGLYSEHLGIDGSFHLRSAGEVSLGRRSNLTVPKEVIRPEDSLGDDDSNYKAAGRYGNGPAHTLTVEPVVVEAPEEDTTPGETPEDPENPIPLTGPARVAGAADSSAHADWKAIHTLVRHARDYSHLVGSTAGGEDARGQEPAPFYRELQGRQFLSDAPTRRIYIDPRLGEVEVYGASCDLTFHRDGNVSLTGRAGEGLQMVNGNLILTAPGDILLQAGRSVVSLAGRDLIGRAKAGVDLSATDGSLRLKAAVHAQVLAGASGTGMLLLEGQGLGAGYDVANKVGDEVQGGGIVLRSAADLVLGGQDLYLRSGLENDGGSIHVDAATGTGDIHCTARVFDRELTVLASDRFQGGVVNRYAAGANVLGSSLGVLGQIGCSGSVVVQEHFISVGGHIATALSEQYGGLVGVSKGENLRQSEDALASLTDDQETDAQESFEKLYQQGVTERWYGENRAGSPDVLEELGFSFRTDQEYGTREFRLYETRWQQTARLSGQELPVWSEQPVERAGQQTYPWPGRQALIEDNTFYSIDLQLVDAASGLRRSADDPLYSQATLEVNPAQVLDEAYRVVG